MRVRPDWRETASQATLLGNPSSRLKIGHHGSVDNRSAKTAVAVPVLSV